VVLNFTVSVRLKESGLVILPKQHVRIEVPVGAIECKMAQESSAFHPFAHHSAGEARGLPHWPRDPAVLPLSAFDQVSVVSRKQLVTTVSGQNNSHTLGCEFGNHVGRNCRRIAEWFVEIP